MRRVSKAKARWDRLVEEVAGERPLDWRNRATAAGCQVCPRRGASGDAIASQFASARGRCDGYLHGHHVIRRQVLERLAHTFALDRQLDDREHAELLVELVWDPRNGMGACERAHRRHHNGIERIEFALVPAAAVAFAVEHALERYLEDEYA